ncbi:MAG: sulfatase [Planctomycetes bacterium]|nr:sulfatase [Planctomycetota bacterium]
MRLIWQCLLVVVALHPLVARAESPPSRPPNIVLVLADDLGWADLACYGADLHETPHLDHLARQGLRFTQAYAPAPVCTPTRAALLTGRHPARLQMTIWSEGSLQRDTDRPLRQARSRHDLPHSEITLAKLLQQRGYLTATVGKWHLGDAAHAPETHGFDINIGGTHWGAPQTFFWPYRGAGRFGGEFRYVPHLEFGRPGEYLTDRLTDEALRVIDHAVAVQRPFFLELAHHAPHTPIEAPAADVDYFQARLRPEYKHQNPGYAAMVKRLDDSVGRVLARLAERGLSDSTIVIFTSDNGGYIGIDGARQLPVTSNFPLRSGKGTLYEGGLRVPLLVRWPGVTASDSVCRAPVVLTDLFPTLLASANVSFPQGLEIDSVSLLDQWRDPQAPLKRESLYFHYPHYYHAPPSTPASAVRSGDWKLLEFFEDQHLELFNLGQDPSEQHDLSRSEPDRAQALLRQLQAWRKQVDAQLPERN